MIMSTRYAETDKTIRTSIHYPRTADRNLQKKRGSSESAEHRVRENTSDKKEEHTLERRYKGNMVADKERVSLKVKQRVFCLFEPLRSGACRDTVGKSDRRRRESGIGLFRSAT